eukprot:188249_1
MIHMQYLSTTNFSVDSISCSIFNLPYDLMSHESASDADNENEPEQIALNMNLSESSSEDLHGMSNDQLIAMLKEQKRMHRNRKRRHSENHSTQSSMRNHNHKRRRVTMD